jgi:hypothetical protein
MTTYNVPLYSDYLALLAYEALVNYSRQLDHEYMVKLANRAFALNADHNGQESYHNRASFLRSRMFLDARNAALGPYNTKGI